MTQDGGRPRGAVRCRSGARPSSPRPSSVAMGFDQRGCVGVRDGGHFHGCHLRRDPGSREHRTDADVDRPIGRIWCVGVVVASRCPRPRTHVRTAPGAGREEWSRFRVFCAVCARGRYRRRFPGSARRKNWWRNLRQAGELLVWIEGACAAASGHAITAAADFPEAHSVYGRRWPRIRVDEQAMLARMHHHLDAAGSAGE